MTRFIIFFAIIAIWVILNIIKAGNRKNVGGTSVRGQEKPVDRNRLSGKKYSWTWMQTAGALHLEFIRPEKSNGYPALRGTIRKIELLVQAFPPTGNAPESTLFHFQFPEPAQIGLNLVLAADPAELKKVSAGQSSQSMQEVLKGRTLKGYFLQVGNLEIFKRRMSAECLDHLCRLQLIYPKIILSDTDLQIYAAGINNDPQGFRQQLNALLQIADCFALFAAGCTVRKDMTVPGSSPSKQASEISSEPETGPGPEPVTEPETELLKPQTAEPETVSGPMPGKKEFLHMLWSAGNTPQQQKAIFEKYMNTEVEWSGILKMACPCSTDFVFARVDGIKAAFELDEFKPEGSFMPIKIKAVAAFPKETAQPFSNAYGKIFRFRGKLFKIEPVTREIYLAGCSFINGVEP